MHPAKRARLRRKHQQRIERVENELGVDATYLVHRDPLNPDAIPATAQAMELDWAPEVDTSAPRPNWWASALVVTASAFALRLVPEWSGTAVLYLVVIAFGLGHLEQFAVVGQAAAEPVKHQHHVFEGLFLFAQVLGALGVVPDRGVFQRAGDLRQLQ